ncbi:hypothetical protein ACH5AO_04910 [Streptomyces sp. NPDC018964]|uniref:hypothetical protein n=1 Tax=unclassified Streptomyces TaxID=2593676 RepID=UPI0037AA7B1B
MPASAHFQIFRLLRLDPEARNDRSHWGGKEKLEVKTASPAVVDEPQSQLGTLEQTQLFKRTLKSDGRLTGSLRNTPAPCIDAH